MTSSSSDIMSSASQSEPQPTVLPTRKVTAGVIAGAVLTISVWVVNTYGLLPKQEKIPAEITGAMQVLLTFMVAYMVPPGKEEGLVQAGDKILSGHRLSK